MSRATTKAKEVNRTFDYVTESVVELEEAMWKMEEARQSDFWTKEEIADLKAAEELAQSATDMLKLITKNAYARRKALALLNSKKKEKNEKIQAD